MSAITLLKLEVARQKIETARAESNAASFRYMLAETEIAVLEFCSRNGIEYTGIHREGITKILENAAKKGFLDE